MAGFRDNRAGSICCTLAVLAPLLVLLTGASVDIGLWLQARGGAQAALSAAAMAGGRMLQLSGGNHQLSSQSAREAFHSNLQVAASGRLTIGTLSFDIGSDSATFIARATAWIETPMLSLIGIRQLPVVDAGSETDRGAGGRSGTTTGANLGASKEIAVALDLSASLSESMLASLKAALDELVDVAVWSDQGKASSRIGLVPFADAVEAGPLFAAATGGVRPGLCTEAGCQRLHFERRGAAGCLDPGMANVASCDSRIFAASTCVTGRRDGRLADDEAPASAPLEPFYPNANGICHVRSAVLPLTADRQRLDLAVADLTAGGSSAPHLGIAWAWRLLSPKWASQMPAESRAASYQDVKTTLANGQKQLRKIAILVQSGGRTAQHCKGVDDRLISCAAPAGPSAGQVSRMCVAMRRQGIELFIVAIGLGANRPLEEAMKDQCAGRDSVYYAVETGEQLRQAFRDIAIEISPMVVTH